MQFGDFSLRHREHSHPLKHHLLVKGCDVLLIATDAVEPFGDNEIKAPAAAVFQEVLISRSQVRSAVEAGIGVGFYDDPTMLLDKTPAEPELVLKRGVALEVAGVPGVNCCFHD